MTLVVMNIVFLTSSFAMAFRERLMPDFYCSCRMLVFLESTSISI